MTQDTASGITAAAALPLSVVARLALEQERRLALTLSSLSHSKRLDSKALRKISIFFVLVIVHLHSL